ncbi:MAG TPA: hypothetical protein VK084_11150 [Chitinophagaceae bacterium]|nr:hypothetical protein [Chitinophagaceae bacterium]
MILLKEVKCIVFGMLILVVVNKLYAFQPKENHSALSVGIAEQNITPSTHVKNWVTGKPYGSVLDSIFVRVIVLDDGNKNAAIVTWDLVDVSESAKDEVRKAISTKTKIPVNNILINASHNHSAPWSPVYKAGYRGKELDTWWAIRYMPAQNEDPYFKKWMQLLIDQSVIAAQKAIENSQPACVWIGRADVSEFLSNRRPISDTLGIEKDNTPSGYNFSHEDWNPNITVGGASFGPKDPTMTFLSFRNSKNENIASVFHLSAHAVAIYPYHEGISGDWPSETIKKMNEAFNTQVLFVQGAAGDINPWKRDRDAVIEMSEGLTEYAKQAYKYSAKLKNSELTVSHSFVSLPLDKKGKQRTGLDSIEAEIQLITYGSLAVIALPGEPLTDLGIEIRKNSPFPQTIVLGYSNGNGVHYVGMPGEKARGGYEMESGTIGDDKAGDVLVKSAIELLKNVTK